MKRIESDLIGSLEVSAEALYGVQTLRGIENFPISCFHLCDYPLFINGLAVTKLGAAMANHQLGLLTDRQFEAISQACREILAGQHHDQFPVDMIQGGAGTTTNMNANILYILFIALPCFSVNSITYTHVYHATSAITHLGKAKPLAANSNAKGLNIEGAVGINKVAITLQVALTMQNTHTKAYGRV